MSDLTPEYLAILRDAATCMHEDGTLATVPRGGGYVVTSQLYPLDSSDPVDVRWLCYTDTLGGAETIRTLLGAVPRLLDEIDRLSAAIQRVRNMHTPSPVLEPCGHDHTGAEILAGTAHWEYDRPDLAATCRIAYTACLECCHAWGQQTDECRDIHDWHREGHYCNTIRALDGES